MSIELLHPWEYPHTLLSDPAEIKAHLASGVLDPVSAEHYGEKHDHFVELVHRRGPASLALAELHDREDVAPEQLAKAEAAVASDPLVSLRLSGNLRNDNAGDWQAQAMGGGVITATATAYYSGTAGTPTATTLPDSGSPAWTVNQWKGFMVHCPAAGSYGVVLSNTASVLTVDRWNTYSSPGGSTGTTPSASAVYSIAGLAPLMFLANSNDAGAPATTDTALASEITSNGFGRALGLWTHTAVSGGTTTTVTSNYTLSKTFTSTGTQSAQKCALFYSAVASTGTPMFENTFAQVSTISGDTVAETWSIAV